MAVNANNVSTGKPKLTGAISCAPITSSLTIPTDATTALSASFVTLGFVSEDGLTNDVEMDTNEIKAWGGSIVFRTVTGMTDNFTFGLIESKNADVLKAVYGDSNVTVGTNGDISVNVVVEDPQEKCWVIDMVLRSDTDGTSKVKRIVIPDGAITSREGVTYNDSDPITYNVTLTAYPDANGVCHKEYIA